MKYKYNYSIIIPHKDHPELLVRCLSSIPKRDDLQIIIVDDNSNINILETDRFHIDKEKNIEIILDKSGKRQGHARNIGIDHAEGKWLIFMDSDDFFMYSINKALDEYRESDADIVYFMSTILDSETYVPYPNQNNLPNNSINQFLRGDKHGEHFVRFRYPAPWGKFYKTDMVRKHNIRFAEIERLEDSQFSYQCGYYANKIIVNNYSVYCYVKRLNTVTSQITSRSAFTTVKVCADCMCFLSEKSLGNTPTYDIMRNILFDNLFSMKQTHNEYYNEAVDYLLGLGMLRTDIERNIKRQRIINLKRKILKLFK